jgi:hypothetical protein
MASEVWLFGTKSGMKFGGAVVEVVEVVHLKLFSSAGATTTGATILITQQALNHRFINITGTGLSNQ